MICKYLSRSLKRKLRCRLYKRDVICLDECKSCSNFILKRNKEMKKVSSKQRKVEQNRFSILTGNLNQCYECGKTSDQTRIDIHEIYKGSNRQASMKNGFCIPLCRECHQRTENDIKFYRKFQKICKAKFLEVHDVAEFISILGKNI